MDSVFEEFLIINHENTMFFEKLKFAMIADEYVQLRENGVILEGVNFKSIIDRVVQWLKDIKNKIKKLFQKFIGLFKKKSNEALKQTAQQNKDKENSKTNYYPKDDKFQLPKKDTVTLIGPDPEYIFGMRFYNTFITCAQQIFSAADYIETEMPIYSKKSIDNITIELDDNIKEVKEFIDDIESKTSEEKYKKYEYKISNAYSVLTQYDTKHLDNMHNLQDKFLDTCNKLIARINEIKKYTDDEIEEVRNKKDITQARREKIIDYDTSTQKNILTIIDIVKTVISMLMQIFQAFFKFAAKAQGLAIRVVSTTYQT